MTIDIDTIIDTEDTRYPYVVSLLEKLQTRRTAQVTPQEVLAYVGWLTDKKPLPRLNGKTIPLHTNG